MKTEYISGKSPSIDDLVLLFQYSDPDYAQVQEDMITRAKHNYVKSKHTRKISQIHSKSKYKDGKWKTYVYIGGKRKVVEAKTEDDIYSLLYDHYKAIDEAEKTLQDVFQSYKTDKRMRGRSEQTLTEDTRRFNYLDDRLKKKAVTLITEEELCSWLTKSFMTRRPKPVGLKKMVQFLNSLFEYACRKRLCNDNPARWIDYHNYLNGCNLDDRENEERSFSDEEIDRLRDYALDHTDNPHAVAMLISMETGLRVGELVVLKNEDIHDGLIHVHRQQIRDTQSGHQHFGEVSYTKNEKNNPHGGRYVPISDRCQDAIEVASRLPGESEYLLHNSNGRPIQKDSYSQYLRRVCRSLGIEISHNHAFRVAYNARLINANIDGNDRSLILGHSAQTNERHYSFSDRRRLDAIRDKLSTDRRT